MTQTQINRAEMFDTVQAYLDTNAAIWNGIPIITTFKTNLDSLLTQLQEHQEAQEASKVFLGKNKAMLKKIVAEKLDILNDTLEAYASVEANAELENKAAKSYSDIYGLRNEDFITTVKETTDLLETNLANLAEYGLTEGQIDDLKSSFDNYMALHGKPRLYQVQSAVATASLDDLVKEISELITGKLDKLMKRFKRTNPAFYKGYESARVIVGN